MENKADVTKYGEVICDFNYFTGSEAFERRLDSSPVLSEVDQELRENYIELLSSFYFLFESIFKYITELNRFIEDVQEGIYIQMSLETILYDKEGKQLLVRFKQDLVKMFLLSSLILITDGELVSVWRHAPFGGHLHGGSRSREDAHLILPLHGCIPVRNTC